MLFVGGVMDGRREWMTNIPLTYTVPIPSIEFASFELLNEPEYDQTIGSESYRLTKLIHNHHMCDLHVYVLDGMSENEMILQFVNGYKK